MSDMDYDPRSCRHDSSDAFVACQRGRCACKDEDMDQIRARVAELESQRFYWTCEVGGETFTTSEQSVATEWACDGLNVIRHVVSAKGRG